MTVRPINGTLRGRDVPSGRRVTSNAIGGPCPLGSRTRRSDTPIDSPESRSARGICGKGLDRPIVDVVEFSAYNWQLVRTPGGRLPLGGAPPVTREHRKTDGSDWTLTIVIPVYNEVATLPQLLERVRAVPYRKQVLLADDGSTDGSTELVRAASEHDPDVEAVFHAHNQGKGAALRVVSRRRSAISSSSRTPISSTTRQTTRHSSNRSLTAGRTWCTGRVFWEHRIVCCFFGT